MRSKGRRVPGFLERSPERSGRVTRIQVSKIEVKFCRVTEDPVLTLGRVENLGTAVQGLSATRERAARGDGVTRYAHR